VTPPKKWRRGFPSGSAELVLPQAYYEEIYARDFEMKIRTWRPWSKQSGKHLWYATLMLATPPIYDLGCGAGHLAAMCKDFGHPEWYRCGIDYSRSAIFLAQHQAPWATFVHGCAAGHIDLAKRSAYATAVLLEVLEHVYEDYELLLRVPEGRSVIFSVPSFPTEGHCRWFANAGQVKERYAPVVAIERVIVEEGINSENRWFIVKGRRT